MLSEPMALLHRLDVANFYSIRFISVAQINISLTTFCLSVLNIFNKVSKPLDEATA